jgi:hypothetical protein
MGNAVREKCTVRFSSPLLSSALARLNWQAQDDAARQNGHAETQRPRSFAEIRIVKSEARKHCSKHPNIFDSRALSHLCVSASLREPFFVETAPLSRGCLSSVKFKSPSSCRCHRKCVAHAALHDGGTTGCSTGSLMSCRVREGMCETSSESSQTLLPAGATYCPLRFAPLHYANHLPHDGGGKQGHALRGESTHARV